MFNIYGRKIPEQGDRVFDKASKNFYKINYTTGLKDFENFYIIAKESGLLPEDLDPEPMTIGFNKMVDCVKQDANFKNLFNGPVVPFAIKIPKLANDVGDQLEDFFLNLVKKSFYNRFPNYQFKATLQGKSKLRQRLTYAPHSKYSEFARAVSTCGVVGLYFPTALQEYDIPSQQKQLLNFPLTKDFQICLAGHIEASYSLIVKPDLLYSKNSYSPVLCLSALQHEDPRMVPLYKAYGPHLEFWLMSQMLAPGVVQVSEQWAGGLTIYQLIK